MIKRAIIFIVVIFALSCGWKEAVLSGVYKMDEGMYAKPNDLFLSDNQHDVLFIGNSRYEYQITPDSMDLTTQSGDKLTAYNGSLSGSYTGLQLSVLEHAINEGKAPKVLVANFDFTLWRYKSLSGQANLQERYLPYLHIAALRDQISCFDARTHALHYLAPYYVTAFDDNLYYASYKGYSQNYSYADHSFRPDGHWLPPDKSMNVFFHVREHEERMPIINETELVSTKKIIELCREHDIHLVAMAPPIYESSIAYFKTDNFTYPEFLKIMGENKVPIIDLSDIEMCRDKENFADELHLNSTGVPEFNRLLEEKLQAYILTLHIE